MLILNLHCNYVGVNFLTPPRIVHVLELSAPIIKQGLKIEKEEKIFFFLLKLIYKIYNLIIFRSINRCDDVDDVI